MKTEPTKNAPAEVQEEGNIDKIRDILFGTQARDFERKFSRLEERISNDIVELREENRKKLDTLEAFIKSEIKSITDRLKSEETSRVDSTKELSQEIKQIVHLFETKVNSINEKSASNESEFRQVILAQSKTLTDEIQQKHNEVMSRLNREASEIREDKTDRTALAEIFTEMAMRLTNEFKLPGK